MSAYYIDTSAALKLLVEESHSQPFAGFYDTHAGAGWVSSTLLRVEVMRVITRAMPAAIPDARELLLAFDYITIDDDVIDAAMNEPDRMLRSLDAIHLASARLLLPELDGLATYDDRLAAAATAAAIRVIDPRDLAAGRRRVARDEAHACSFHAAHQTAYDGSMPLVQVRDVPESTLRALKSRAAERGLTLSAYLRVELDRLAARPSNAEVVERLARRHRHGGPTVADTLTEIRRTRDAS